MGFSPELSWLSVYCVLILLASLAGGSVPFLGRVTHSRLQLYLSASAGIMLGAAFFHIMPEAMKLSGAYFGWWMSLGVVGIFCIERFIAPHSHEMDNGHQGHDHHHEHELPHDEHRTAAPSVAGWMAVLGLTLHTFMNGVGLAGSVQDGISQAEAGQTLGGLAAALPGAAMFFAIVFHKPADALAISMVLSRKGVSRRKLSLVQLGFGLMVPLGVAAFFIARGLIGEKYQGSLDQLTGAALAFSAGTFLFIALSDLLPEVQFHRHDRVPLFVALAAGIIFMGAIALLEEHGGHEHGGHSHADEAHHPGHDADEDHDHDH